MHNVVQGYIYVTVCSLLFIFVLYLSYLFRLNTPPPHGTVGSVTFRSGYLSFSHLTHAMPMLRGNVFGMTSPLY